MKRELQFFIISLLGCAFALLLQQPGLLIVAIMPALFLPSRGRYIALGLVLVSYGGFLGQLSLMAGIGIGAALILTIWCQRLLSKDLSQSAPIMPIQAIERLAAGIAHQFNNMLTPVLGYAELSQQCLDGNERVLSYQKQIHHSASRAKNLIEQMLNFSEPAPAQKQWVWLKDVVDEAIQLARAIAPSTTKVGSKISHDNIQINVDAEQFHRLLMALLTNAIEAIGGRPGLVELHCELKAKNVCLRVSDNGVGMSEQVSQRMFEPLFTTKGESWRTGMGLAVVQGILASHNLNCQVSSDHRNGTQIDIELQAHLGVLDILPGQQNLPSFNRHYHSAEARFCYGEVLVLAEDVALSQLICAQLDSIGFRVHHFHHSMAALKWCKQQKRVLDLVVIDIGLPYCSALDALGELRSLRDDLPSLLLVGGGEDQELLDQLQVLPVNVIRKPYVAAQFYSEVLGLMGQRKSSLQVVRDSA